MGIFVAGGSPLDAGAFYLGSLFPDVDTLWNDWNVYRKDFLGHRGITHSLTLALFFLLVSFGVYLYYPFLSFVFFFFLGAFLHVVLDAFSPTGVPLYLSYRPRVRFPLYKTGTKLDEFLALCVAAVLLAIGYYVKRHSLEFTELESVIKKIIAFIWEGKINLS
jgi:membrane-bound metal-dependent hydrolase YbcI (DUF457 family)